MLLSLMSYISDGGPGEMVLLLIGPGSGIVIVSELLFR